MRNDAHVHIWPKVVPLPKRLPVQSGGNLEDLFVAMDRAGVARAAAITPRAMNWDDSATLAAARAHSDRLVAVVRHDVANPRSPSKLAASIEAGARGVRITTDDGSLIAFNDADSFWDLVCEAGVSVAINATPDELSIVDSLAQDHPEATILLDHSGRPDVSAGVAGTAFQRVLALSDRRNVMVKTPNVPFFSQSGPPFEDLDDFLDAVLDRFGAERVLWGTDWPLCTVETEYTDAIAPIDRALERRSLGEASLVLRDNFARVYGHG